MKKICCLFIVVGIIFNLFTVLYAANGGINVGQVCFLNKMGIEFKTFPPSGNTVYAKTIIENNYSGTSDILFIIAIYEKGVMLKMEYSGLSLESGQISEVSKGLQIPDGINVSEALLKAYVWDSISGENIYAGEATFLHTSTALEGIKINGNWIDGYSDDVDTYRLQTVKGSSIMAVPLDQTTKVSVSDYEVPGQAVITVTPAIVSEETPVRKIKLLLYENEIDNYTLSKLSYVLDGETYEIPNFSSETLSYEVELPDNTFFVRLIGVSSGDVTYAAQDIYNSSNGIIINGVNYGKLDSATAGTAFNTIRPTNDAGIIPIKNEASIGVVYASNGTRQTKYSVTFKSKQPRLTSFNMSEAAASDTFKPAFMGGAALYKDNGSVAFVDRRWGFCFLSKPLLGASMFMTAYDNNIKQWWGTTGKAGDEYFSFTADTGGTVIFMANTTGMAYGNTEDYWTPVHRDLSPGFPSGSVYLQNKDWNDYTKPEYYSASLGWVSDSARTVYPWINALDKTDSSLISGGQEQDTAFSRRFEAGEKVTIYHSGITGFSGAAAMWSILWDVDNQIYDKENFFIAEEEDDPEDEDENPYYEEGLVMKLLTDDNSANGYYDGALKTWHDLSGNNNNAALYVDDNNYWTSKGIVTSGGYGSGTTSYLPDNATEIINTYNFTLEFLVKDIVKNSGRAAVFYSDNGNFRIANESGDNVTFTWAGMLAKPAVNINDVIGKVNVITVSTKDNTINWYVDGMLMASKTFSSAAKTADRIMLNYFGTNYGSDVTLNSIKLYNYAFSADEVAARNVGDFTQSAFRRIELLSDNIGGEDNYISTSYQGGKNEPVKVVLLNPNYDFDTVDTFIVNGKDVNDALAYIGQGKTNASGFYAKNIPIPANSPKGMYSMQTGGKKSYVYYASISDKQAWIQRMKTADDVTALSAIIDECAEYIGINFELYRALDNQVNVAQMCYNDIVEGEIGEDELRYVVNAIDSGVIVSALNEGIMETLGDYLDYIDSSETHIPSSELYEKITDEGKQKIVSLLSLKDYHSIEALNQSFECQLALQAINYPAIKTASNILLQIKTYHNLLGLDISKLISLSNSEQISIAAAFSDTRPELDDVQKTMDNLINDSAPSGANTERSKYYGVGHGGSGVATNVVDASELDAFAAKSKFPDLIGYEWAVEAIKAFSTKGILTGYEDGTFKPSKNITRAEFVTMIVKLLGGVSESSTMNFVDVGIDDWFYPYIASVYSMNIIKGIDEGRFEPLENITRQDMAVILFRAAKYKGVTLNTATTEFIDNSAISDYAVEAVYGLKDANIVKGDDNGKFNPVSLATRAEAALMLYNFSKTIGLEG